MERLIRLSDAIKAIEELPNSYNGWSDVYDKSLIIGTLEEVPMVKPYDLALCEPVIDAVKEEMMRVGIRFVSESYLGKAEKAIEKLNQIPAVEPKHGVWIPCSERLPDEEFETYLICTETGYMCSCRWTNDMYGLGATEWSKWGWHIMDKPQYSVVTAWMPLQPWKGADDEM